jgi:hypothetical protein
LGTGTGDVSSSEAWVLTALRELRRKDLDPLLAQLHRRERTQIARLTGRSSAVGAQLAADLRGSPVGRRLAVAQQLVGPLLRSLLEKADGRDTVAGEEDLDPEVLLDLVGELVDRSGAGAVRLLLAWIHDSELPIANAAGALLFHRADLSLDAWSEDELSPEGRGQLAWLRAGGHADDEPSSPPQAPADTSDSPSDGADTGATLMTDERPRAGGDTDWTREVHQFAAAVEELQRRSEAAAARLEEQADRLRAGEPPARDVVEELEGLRVEFETQRELLHRAAGLEQVAVEDDGGTGGLLRTLTGIAAAKEARHRRTERMAPLEVLARVEARGDDGGAAARLRERVSAALARSAGDPLSDENLDAYAAVLDLMGLVAAGATTAAIDEARQRASTVLGPDTFTVLLGRVTLPEPPDAGSTHPKPASSASPDASPAPAGEARADQPVPKDPSPAQVPGTGALITPETEEPAAPEPGESAAPEPGEPAAPEPGEPAAPEPGEPAALEPGEPAAPEPGEPAAPEPGEPAALEPEERSESELAPAPAPQVDPRSTEPPQARSATEAASAEPTVGASEPEAKTSQNEAEAEAVVAEAVSRGRLGLAGWVYTACDDPVRASATRMLALAGALHSGVGAVLPALNAEAAELDTAAFLDDRLAGKVALAAAVRAALIAPHSQAVPLLRDLTALTAGLDDLDALTGAVIESAGRGIHVADASSDLVHQKDLEEAFGELVADAAALLHTGPTRRIKFDRATRVWCTWIAPDGQLGSLLTAVADDNRDRVEEVREGVVELRKAGELAELIDDTDVELRSKVARGVIEAGARTKLLDWGEECLDIAGAWVDAVEAEDAARTNRGAHRAEGLRRLRVVIEQHREGAVAAVAVAADDEPATGSRKLARAAADLLDDVLGRLTEGRGLPSRETPPRVVLAGDLLRAPTVAMDGWQPRRRPRLPELAAAAANDRWEDAFAQRVSRGDLISAERVVELLRDEDPRLAEELESRRQDALVGHRAALAELQDHASATLSLARRQGYIDEDDLARFGGRLETMDLADREDLDVVREHLETVLAELGAARVRAVADALAKLEDRAADAPHVAEHRHRIEATIREGNLATAEDLLALLEAGQTLVDSEPRDQTDSVLDGFVPAFVEHLESLTLNGAVAEAAEGGGTWNGLDFGELPAERRSVTAEALRGWLRLGDRAYRGEIALSLRPVLTALGLQVSSDRIVAGPKGGDRWNWLEVTEARPIGSPNVPQLGSQAGGRYRFLLVWNEPDPEGLLDIVEEASRDVPVVVLHFGTVGIDDRIHLADEARPVRRNRSVILVDDATLLFVLLNGSGRFDLAARLTLPFTALNPYTPFVAGNVPAEMFFGRKPELHDLLDPAGTSFIYGGRQLGKSALLRAAEREFARLSPAHTAIYLDLKTHGIGAWRRKEELWPLIREALREHGVELEGGGGGDEVERSLRRWMADTDQHALLLLDEADAFLEADADEGFPTVSALKGLMQDIRNRFKVVFAGLHQVQRFLKVPNQPLAHLGRPVPIGPLRPDAAHALVVEPLAALGYRLSDDEVANRILAYSNYQPSIIQLFGDALCRHAVEKPRTDPPPYELTGQHLESVYADREFADQVRHRFELTINLDPRYRVIAYTVALSAHDEGADCALEWRELERRCRTWWPRGFRDETNTDSFRALLDELVGLGILARHRDAEYRLRSPNVLRMLGTSTEIEETLLRAEELEPPQRFEAATFRRALGERERRSPLTERQLSELTEIVNRTHLVLGSRALGIEQVEPAVRLVAGQEEAIEFRKRSLASGKFPGGFLDEEWTGHRLILGDLLNATPEVCRLTLAQATEAAATRREGTVGIVLVLGIDTLSFWREATTRGATGSRPRTVSLRRWDDAAVRVWVQDTDLDLRSEQSRARLLEVTGGWPNLIADVTARTDGGKKLASTVLGDLEAKLGEPAAARKFVETTGLLADEGVHRCWNLLLEYGFLPLQDLAAVAEGLGTGEEDAGRELDLLRALQVVELSEDGADLVPEPVLERAWKRATKS